MVGARTLGSRLQRSPLGPVSGHLHHGTGASPLHPTHRGRALQLPASDTRICKPPLPQVPRPPCSPRLFSLPGGSCWAPQGMQLPCPRSDRTDTAMRHRWFAPGTYMPASTRQSLAGAQHCCLLQKAAREALPAPLWPGCSPGAPSPAQRTFAAGTRTTCTNPGGSNVTSAPAPSSPVLSNSVTKAASGPGCRARLPGSRSCAPAPRQCPMQLVPSQNVPAALCCSCHHA